MILRAIFLWWAIRICWTFSIDLNYERVLARDESPRQFFKPKGSEEYTFGYANHESFKTEKRSKDGTIQGVYGFIDAAGIVRVTEYVADEKGFHITARRRIPFQSKVNSTSNLMETATTPSLNGSTTSFTKIKKEVIIQEEASTAQPESTAGLPFENATQAIRINGIGEAKPDLVIPGYICFSVDKDFMPVTVASIYPNASKEGSVGKNTSPLVEETTSQTVLKTTNTESLGISTTETTAILMISSANNTSEEDYTPAIVETTLIIDQDTFSSEATSSAPISLKESVNQIQSTSPPATTTATESSEKLPDIPLEDFGLYSIDIDDIR